MNGGDRPRGGGRELVLHLHRFEDDQALAFLDRVARLSEDAEDEAGHRRAHLAVRGGITDVEPKPLQEPVRLCLHLDLDRRPVDPDARRRAISLDGRHAGAAVHDDERGLDVRGGAAEHRAPRVGRFAVDGDGAIVTVEVEGEVAGAEGEGHGRGRREAKGRECRTTCADRGKLWLSAPAPPVTLTPDLLLAAYRAGAFPMADPDDGERIGWYAPDPRAVLPLDAFHVPKTLARTVRAGRFRVTADAAFERVMRACAAPAPGREQTWISDEIVSTYTRLHDLGFAHSVECWDGERFAGGLYGVALGGVFFGESMVSRERDASKVALVWLVRRLRAGGFVLLDTQMSTPHLERFGVVEISRDEYERRLGNALAVRASWSAFEAEGGESPTCS